MTSAFAPAHVSGLFAVHDEAEDVLARGSRGAGWSLDLGATAKVERTAGASAIRVNGKPTVANVTRLALHKLEPQVPLDVDLRLDLPVGQGFGMSAAGSLSACLAAANLLDLEPERALDAAHAAEVESGTGLGDAVAAWHGGGELRLRAGVPPHGQVTRIDAPGDAEFLFAVVGEPIPTPSIIRDPAWKGTTQRLGDAAVDRIIATGRSKAWDTLLAESARFSRDLGLMSPAVAALGGLLPAGIPWGQSMLGSTLWVAGHGEGLPLLAEAEKVLRKAGPVIRTGVDAKGTRLVRDKA